MHMYVCTCSYKHTYVCLYMIKKMRSAKQMNFVSFHDIRCISMFKNIKTSAIKTNVPAAFNNW